MTSQAEAGYKVLLKRGDGGDPETFDDIAEVRDLTPPQLEAATAEVTSRGSGGWREYITTLKDGGEITFDVNFLPGTNGHAVLIDDWRAGTLRNYKVIFPDGSEWLVPALVTKVSPDASLEDQLSAEITLKVSGEITFTPASG